MNIYILIIQVAKNTVQSSHEICQFMRTSKEENILRYNTKITIALNVTLHGFKISVS